MKIRRATFDDKYALLELGRKMHAESPRFSKLEYSDAKAEQLFNVLLSNPNGVVLIADDESQIIGMMAGFASEHFFSQQLFASDFVLFIEPEHRGGTAAMRLVKEFEKWATDLGVAEIVLGISTEVHAERTAELYGRLGFDRSGFTMIKRV